MVRIGYRSLPQHGDWQRHARRVARGRAARSRVVVDVGPLLPAERRPGRKALRVLDGAGRAGPGDGARGGRRPRHVQLVPQPEPPRRHGAHGRPHLGRTAHPRHRLRLVRARLRGVRLRVRHGRQPPTRPRPRPADHQGALGEAQPAAREADPDLHRRPRQEGDAAHHRRARATSGTASATSRRCGS